MASTMHVSVRFPRESFQEIMTILISNGLPVSSFVGSIDQIAAEKGVQCFRCKDYIVDNAGKMDPTHLYGFFVVNTESVARLISDLLASGQSQLMCADDLSSLLETLRPMCSDCRSPPHSDSTPSHHSENVDSPPTSATAHVLDVTSYAPAAKRFVAEDFPKSKGRKAKKDEEEVFTKSTLMSILNAHLNMEEAAAAKFESENDNIAQFGAEIPLDLAAPDAQQAKCKLCMRILRTTRGDPSRMRTLKYSHARNHMTKPQFACKVCNYGCRFFGGIQLHMRRHHVGKEKNYIDRSKEDWYKSELTYVVDTCF